MTLTAETLPRLLNETFSREIYNDVVEAARIAPSLDWLESPFSDAGKAIYVFMTEVDVAWSSALPRQMGADNGGSWDPEDSLGFLRAIPLVARAKRVDEAVVVNIATATARTLRGVSRRSPDNPSGPAIPASISDSLLLGAKIFGVQKLRC